MPGRLFLTRPIDEVAAILDLDPAAVEQEPPRRNIQPGQQVVTVASGPEFRRMRWGLIPVGRKNARGRPVMETIINARSESLFAKTAFAGVTRCVVPADGWYEWTGAKRRKTAWEIRSADGSVLWFAAICDVWTAPGGQALWQVATVTCPPNADVRGIHDRMGVLLPPCDVPLWISGPEDAAADLMRVAEDGSLAVAEAEGVDWQGA